MRICARPATDFTQLDIEMSFVDTDDVIELTSDCSLTSSAGASEVELPMRRLPYDEAIGRYGSDKPGPALRPGAARPHGDLPRLGVQGLRLGDRGRRVGARAHAGRREMSRSELDGLVSEATELGAKGLVWAVVEADGWRSPVAKFLSDAEIAKTNEVLRRARATSSSWSPISRCSVPRCSGAPPPTGGTTWP